MVVIDIPVHQLYHTFQGCFTASKQVFLEHADIVEAVNLVTLLNPLQRLVLSVKFPQDNRLHGTSLVIVTIADKGTLQFIKGILPTFVSNTDTSSLEIAGICPRLVPCRFPEVLIGSILFTKIFADDTEIE